jgi:tripartite-type tricarboxylate transporter receptor subunit TctC
MIQRRTFLQAAAAAGVSSAVASAWADTFPSHSLAMTVPYAPGGNGDFTARIVAEGMSRVLGQTVVVENRAGGGGALGANYVIKARPDGYTLLFTGTGVFSVTPQLVDAKYGIGDIKGVGFASKTPMVLVAPKNSKYKTLDDLMQGVRSGAKLEVGYGGVGTPNHLAVLNLETLAKAPIVGVPYKGSAPMLQDLLGGQIAAGTDQMTTSKSYIESGALVALGVFGAPLESLPKVPSVSTLGPELFDVNTYLGLAAPLGTPDAVVATLRGALKQALDDPKLKQALAQVGSATYAGDGKDFENFMRRENDLVAQMIAQGKIAKQS